MRSTVPFSFFAELMHVRDADGIDRSCVRCAHSLNGRCAHRHVDPESEQSIGGFSTCDAFFARPFCPAPAGKEHRGLLCGTRTSERNGR